MVIEVDLKSESDFTDVEVADVHYSSSDDEHYRYRPDADEWRTRLCLRGSDCQDPHCNHAHCLAELRPPNETRVLHPEVWAAGIGRFYGQAMTAELLRVFNDYYFKTHEFECPLWAHALYFSIKKHDLLADAHFPWDYGLTMDVDVLRRGRVGGQRPFEYLPGLWGALQSRERQLAFEQDYN